MKRTQVSIWGGLCLAAILSACSAEDPDMGQTAARMIPVKTTLGFDTDTRTILSEEGTALKWQWKKNDRVDLVSKTTGLPIGYMTAQEPVAGTDGATYTFTGEIDANYAGQDMYIHYFGTGGVNIDHYITSFPSKKTLRLDFSKQDGTLDKVGCFDWQHSAKATIPQPVGGEIVLDDFKVNRQMAIVKFNIGVADAEVTMTGTFANKISFSEGFVTNVAIDNNQLSAKTDADGNMYVAMIPDQGNDYGDTWNFSVTDADGAQYEGTLNAHLDITESIYYRQNDGSGIPVNVKKVNTGADHSKNPLLKWAETDLAQNGTGASARGKFASTPYSGAAYFQFGRNRGYANETAAATNFGWDINIKNRYGKNAYRGDGSTTPVPTFNPSTTNFANYPDWFLVGDSQYGDYRTPRYGETWEERAKSNGYTYSTPCPEGWKIPSSADFKEILPEINGVTGFSGFDVWENGYAQIKTLADGTRCAFKWEGWQDDATRKYFMRVYCLVVDSSVTSVTVDDAIWTNQQANVVTRDFAGNGFLVAGVFKATFNAAGSNTQILCRPADWGEYTTYIINSYVAGLSRTTSWMDQGGAYWTSDARQAMMSIGFNISYNTTMNTGIHLVQMKQSVAATIRPIKDPDYNK